MKVKFMVLLFSFGSAILLTTCASRRTLHLAKGQDPLTFNHQLSAFPLVGAHAKFPCQSCHVAGQYRETPTRCQNCHAGSIAHANDTNSNCELCHSTWNWQAVSFNHNQLRFALQGKHAQVDCLDCHKTNSFSGLGKESSLCSPTPSAYGFSCHEDVHRGTMGAKCQVCHSEMLWKPARFDHRLTAFPLTGKHATLDCSDCHKDAFAAATPKQCVACHQKDAPQDHFGPQCADCHTSSGWKPARFDHSVFPINAGPHRKATCEDCHTARGFYKEFSCIIGGCHPQDKMEQKHRNKSGYVYESFACFKCHPRGREED